MSDNGKTAAGAASHDASTIRRQSATTTRRSWLALGGASVATALGGCVGLGGSSSDGSAITTTAGGNSEPNPPWTTDELAEMARQEGGPMMLYTTWMSKKEHQSIADKIAELYPFFELEVVRSYSGALGQRYLEEKNAGKIIPDVMASPTSLLNDQKLVKENFVGGIPENFAFAQQDIENKDLIVFDRWVHNVNYGPLVGLLFNPKLVDEQGLPIKPFKKRGYNAFFDEAWRDVKVNLWSNPLWRSFGWRVKKYAEERGMTPSEWLQALNEHVNINLMNSPTDAARRVGNGHAVGQINGFVHNPIRFQELDLDCVFPDPSPYMPGDRAFMEVKGSDKPWTARFYLSVLLEPEIQAFLATPGDVMYPGLLAYKADAEPYVRKVIGTEMINVSIEEAKELRKIGQQAFDATFN